MTPIVQCVPNFSEGRRPDVMAAIVEAVRGTPGVRLADWSADPDHNRLVVTFVGPPGAVCAAARAACAVAITQIDLREHEGVHPRLGALDVLPLVPLSGISLSDCASHARELGRELAALHGLPVFLYEAASPPDGPHPNPPPQAGEGAERRSLPFVRKEAFHSLLPDFGPPKPHPSAGAVVVGARGPLVAYNVNLATPAVRAAKTIARELREGGGAGFVGVRALGLYLPSRHLAQVSMNITRPEQTPLLPVFSYIARRAEELGTMALESEIIGALPGGTAFGVLGDALRASGLKPGQVLWENWPTTK